MGWTSAVKFRRLTPGLPATIDFTMENIGHTGAEEFQIWGFLNIWEKLPDLVNLSDTTRPRGVFDPGNPMKLRFSTRTALSARDIRAIRSGQMKLYLLAAIQYINPLEPGTCNTALMCSEYNPQFTGGEADLCNPPNFAIDGHPLKRTHELQEINK